MCVRAYVRACVRAYVRVCVYHIYVTNYGHCILQTMGIASNPSSDSSTDPALSELQHF